MTESTAAEAEVPEDWARRGEPPQRRKARPSWEPRLPSRSEMRTASLDRCYDFMHRHGYDHIQPAEWKEPDEQSEKPGYSNPVAAEWIPEIRRVMAEARRPHGRRALRPGSDDVPDEPTWSHAELARLKQETNAAIAKAARERGEEPPDME